MSDERPAECCGACPPIVGGGYDCTCENNPRCPVYQKKHDWAAIRTKHSQSYPDPGHSTALCCAECDEWVPCTTIRLLDALESRVAHHSSADGGDLATKVDQLRELLAAQPYASERELAAEVERLREQGRRLIVDRNTTRQQVADLRAGIARALAIGLHERPGEAGVVLSALLAGSGEQPGEAEVRESVERGLGQSARGETVDLGDFTQYARPAPDAREDRERVEWSLDYYGVRDNLSEEHGRELVDRLMDDLSEPGRVSAEQARAEADRRYPHTDNEDANYRRAARRLAFIAGAAWATRAVTDTTAGGEERDLAQEIAEALTKHRARPAGSPHCICGWRPAMYLNDTESDADQHRYHQAQVIVAAVSGRADEIPKEE